MFASAALPTSRWHMRRDRKSQDYTTKCGLKAHKSGLVRDYLNGINGPIQIAFLPPYAPDLNPVEYLWAWLKRHALANFCPDKLGELQTTARNKLKSAQHRPTIIAACWKQVGL